MQRASIARALIGEQPPLLCDEPTGNLSQSAGREVMEELRRAVDEEGRTVVLVTHNPRDATFADRVSILVDGVLDPDRDVVGPEITEPAVLAVLERASVDPARGSARQGGHVLPPCASGGLIADTEAAPMGLASLIARRSVVRRPGSLFSIPGVALGVATVVGVVTPDHATIEGYV